MGLFKKGKIFGNLFASFMGVDENFLEELEEKLILADAGVELAESAVEELRKISMNKGLAGEEVRRTLADILARQMTGVGDTSLKLSTKPSVILMVGVNGVGKTTTIGKLANVFVKDGKKVLLCAADTFRAAASEQLDVWAKRSGADIVCHGEGGDPGAVVFDGCSAAKARGTDIVIVDTAGRLHNKQNLMNELTKISKVIGRELPDADIETLLVIDATTGQNGLLQAESFAKAAGVTGIVLTKLDGTAKGGVVLSIGKTLGVPVKFVGVGEGMDDLVPFDAKQFAKDMVS